MYRRESDKALPIMVWASPRVTRGLPIVSPMIRFQAAFQIFSQVAANCRRQHLSMGQFDPKVLFDVDRDKLSEPLCSAHLCRLLFDEYVVSFCRQMHDAPHIQRA